MDVFVSVVATCVTLRQSAAVATIIIGVRTVAAVGNQRDSVE